MFEEPVVAKPKKVKKPMSEERKQVLREQLRLARVKKKANKLAKEKEEKEEKEKQVKVLETIKEEEPQIKVEMPIKMEVVDQTPIDENLNIIKNLKEEIANLKKGSTSKSDMEEIRELKLEMKEIVAISKAYKKQQKEKEKAKPVLKPVEKQVEKLIQVLETPKLIKPKFSTYKKSKWSQFL